MVFSSIQTISPRTVTMDRNARSGQHQRRKAIEGRAKSAEAIDFFNVLTSPELLEATEALTPEHRERMYPCLLYTSPSPRDRTRSRMPSSA